VPVRPTRKRKVLYGFCYSLNVSPREQLDFEHAAMPSSSARRFLPLAQLTSALNFIPTENGFKLRGGAKNVG
jgi:hypothetical protein